jgi:hypothetical protein
LLYVVNGFQVYVGFGFLRAEGIGLSAIIGTGIGREDFDFDFDLGRECFGGNAGSNISIVKIGRAGGFGGVGGVGWGRDDCGD